MRSTLRAIWLLVPDPNGTVKIRSARDAVYWRTGDYCKLRSSELVLIQKPVSGNDLEALPGSLPENDQGGGLMRQPVQ